MQFTKFYHVWTYPEEERPEEVPNDDREHDEYGVHHGQLHLITSLYSAVMVVTHYTNTTNWPTLPAYQLLAEHCLPAQFP